MDKCFFLSPACPVRDFPFIKLDWLTDSVMMCCVFFRLKICLWIYHHSPIITNSFAWTFRPWLRDDTEELCQQRNCTRMNYKKSENDDKFQRRADDAVEEVRLRVSAASVRKGHWRLSGPAERRQRILCKRCHRGDLRVKLSVVQIGRIKAG